MTRSAFVLALMTLATLPSLRAGELPRALPPGQVPNDRRLEPPKDLDGYFPFTPPTSREAWAKRVEEVRRQLQVALGLWPEPTRTPLNPVIHGPVDRDTYTVEKVYFESVPGFFVTGNLYRPKGKAGPRPGVLCPHGHWEDGRFMDYGPQRVRQEIAIGGERFEEGGRSVLQARCVQLARMGCVVFHYDMIGYADSTQISFDLAHRFATQRPEMNTAENWGLFSPQAEAHLQSIMGLQAWNSIRALDFLLGLPGIDPQRIAVTGASGGGTQTFILGAIDPRPAVAFPAVMVSTAMQGGCTCENACLLRVDTGNVEFAAMFAPKPLGMTAANDWTKEMPTKGFPQLKQHYAMMGASENVMLKPLLHFDHNYNAVSRMAMFSWINKQFKLGFQEPVIEADYKRLSKEEMSVWDAEHPAPPGGPEFERKLLGWLTDDSNRHLQGSEALRTTIAPALDVVLGPKLSKADRVSFQATSTEDKGNYSHKTGLLRNLARGEELPVVILESKASPPHVVIWADERGKAGLFSPSGSQPRPEVATLLGRGITVVGIDLLYQGEFLKDGQPLAHTPRVKNPREAAPYTFGYNRALFAQRVHDLLTTIHHFREQNADLHAVDLVGLDATGPLVAAARAQAGENITRTAVRTGGFLFGKVLDLGDANFLPGGAKYGDLPAMLALGSGGLWLNGAENRDKTIDALARANQAGDTEEKKDAAIAWLLAN